MARTARPGRTGGIATSGALAALVLGAVLAGCGVPVPELPETAPPTVQGGAGVELTSEDPAGAALAAQLEVLDTAVAAVAAALDAAATAADGGDVEAARAAGATAVALLLGGDAADRRDAADRVDGVDDGPGLLPATASDRAGGGTSDLITGTVTLAGDVGGERARVVLELVRDPLVGDLGAWQRDAPGVIDGLRAAVAAAGADAVALDAALASPAGELTRTLGYALAVATAPDVALAAHAAEAAVARLEVVRVALELGVAAVADGA